MRVHAGDPHVAAEWDRPDAVLGLAAAKAPQQRAEEQRESLDAHSDGLGREEVAALVQDDQRGETGEREEIGHREPVWQGALAGTHSDGKAPARGTAASPRRRRCQVTRFSAGDDPAHAAPTHRDGRRCARTDQHDHAGRADPRVAPLKAR